MINNHPLTVRNVASVGEEIGYELGKKMVLDFQVANPDEVFSFTIGRNVIDEILAQPGCVGIRFYNAYNEEGLKTMVYVGLGKEGKPIFEYTVITEHGILENKKGIVADRIRRDTGLDADDWGWGID